MGGGDSGGRWAARLGALTEQIAVYPNAAANYVLRGELYARAGEYALAEADFVKALALTAAQLPRTDWGLVEQAIQDRAEHGLRRVRRHVRGVRSDAISAPSRVPENAPEDVKTIPTRFSAPLPPLHNSAGLLVSETNELSDNERHSDDGEGVRGGVYGEDRQRHD
jgi:tetratricopeptide (TPR) repeat protein